jgi:sulfite exporter TauE/SafE
VIFGGLAFLAAGSSEVLRAFLTWTIGWCLVNLVIVAASWRGKPPKSISQFREFLMLNQGLNVGYIATGLFVGILGKTEVIQSSAWAVLIQGVALLVLDSILLQKVTPSST